MCWPPARTRLKSSAHRKKPPSWATLSRPEVLTADRAAARAKLNAGNRTVILSFGGSLGADRINQVVADLCAWEKQTHRNVLHLHAHRQPRRQAV